MSFFSREKHTDHNPRVYLTLIRRHFKVFFKNKMGVFFSLLVPMITLVIYVIFLRQLQVQAIDNNIGSIIKDIEITEGIKQHAHLLADAWMLSGIVAVSCISVSLNTCTIMLNDRQSGVGKDFVSSPISRRSINVSYLVFNILATFLINFCVLFISYVYLGIVGGFHITIGHTFLLIPVLLLAVVSASLITCFIASFMTSYNTYNGASVIISSASGFLIGSYMPFSMMPPIARRVPLFFPGTYAGGLLRTFCLEDYYANFTEYLAKEEGLTPEQITKIRDTLEQTVSINIDFYGKSVTPPYMVLAIAIFIVLFMILNFIFLDHNLRGNLHGRIEKRKNKKK